MLVVVFDDGPDCIFGVGKVVGLTLLLPEVLSGRWQGQEDHRCPRQRLLQGISEGKVHTIGPAHEFFEAGLEDGGLVELTLGNAGGIDIVDLELHVERETCRCGLWRARTVEVGMPTKPAPKQVTLYIIKYWQRILTEFREESQPHVSYLSQSYRPIFMHTSR